MMQDQGFSTQTREQRLNDNPNLSKKSVQIVQKILSKNDMKAQELREFYAKAGLYVVNLMSSPGSGKTTLLESLALSAKSFRFCVLEGDLQTNRDAQRLQAKGISAYQITTGEACHLDAFMIEQGLESLQKQCDFGQIDYLFIENVGNLVCPASYDLGAHLNIVLLSTPEGDDKILKYPSMFLCADAVVVSKADMMEYFDFKLSSIREDLDKLKSQVPLFLLSSKDEQSVAQLRDFITQKCAENYQSKHQF